MSSPLLRLPLEIRNKIWSEVLGDRLVHLRYLGDNIMEVLTHEYLSQKSNWSRTLMTTYASAWRHVVYEEDYPEDQESKKLTTADGVLSTRSHFTCESNLYYYKTIKPNNIYKDWFCCGHEMMRLSVLRSCRQIYIETNKIIGTTNTFSFAHPMTFKRFVMTRTINQKRSIKSLRLQMKWDYEDTEWNKALNMALVRSISGLRRLRLCISHRIDGTRYENLKSDNGLYTTTCCKSLQKVSTLPLAEVEIVVRNSELISENEENNLWTKVDREYFAEGLRKILLNPKGAEIYAEDQLRWKEECRKKREYTAKIENSMSGPRLEAEIERMAASQHQGPSA